MLTYLATNYRGLNPLDFDNRSIVKAANVLLGKAQTDILLKDRSPKGNLLLLGALEAEAEAVRKNEKRSLPADATPKNAAARTDAAEEIQQWKQLHLNATQETQLPYRLRGENQFRALLENRISLSRSGEGAQAQIQISLADLKKTITEAEKTGTCTISMEMSAEDAEFVQGLATTAQGATLVFQDELAERPETKRAWLGNVASRCEARAKEDGTLPSDELAKISAAYSGRKITLAKGGVVKRAEITKSENNRATVEIEVLLPEIEKAISEAGPANPEPGKGMITDGALRLHAGNAHGCNGRDFVASASELVDALWTNAREATAQWQGKENPTKEDVHAFLADYAGVALTMRSRLRPKNKLEPTRSKVTKAEELLPGGATTPENVYGLESIKDIEATGASCPASAGAEWVHSLCTKAITETWSNQQAETYADALEEKFGLEDNLRKARMIQANFLREEIDGLQPLDGGANGVEMETFYLTEEGEEEFQTEKENRDQEIFDSKAETAKDDLTGASKTEIIKSEWLEERGTISLTLAASGPILHRLKRYNNRRSGIAVGRTKAERMDAEISMPRKESNRWTNKTLRLEDILTDGAKAELDGLMAAGDEWEQREIKEIRELISDWQNSLRRLDPIGKNPMEGRIRSWMEALAADKPEARCQSLDELRTIFGPSVRNAGRIPYEWEKTPEHLQMPVRSTALPVKLLCGTGHAELANVKDNPAELWDMTMRWQCASRLQEEALPLRPETRIDMLLTALESGSPTDIVAHAIVMELAEKPNTLKAYLAEIGLPNGVSSIPQTLADFADLVHPIKNCPKTAQFKEEETSLDDLAEILEENGVVVKPTPDEEKEIAEAVTTSIQTWRANMGTAIRELEAAESPSGKAAAISIILAPGEEEEGTAEKDPFEATLDILHTTMPQSLGDVESIASALLTHAPKVLTIETGNESVTLRRGSGRAWAPEGSDTTEALRVAARVNEVEDAMGKKDTDETVDFETRAAIQRAATKAHGSRISANIRKIEPALKLLPEMVAARPSVTEITEPLKLVTQQLATALKAKELTDSILKEWRDSDDVTSPWGWEEDMTLNPMGAIEFTCNKIMGGAVSAEEENRQRNYYARKLIGDKEKIEAAEILGKSGKRAAAHFLQEVVEKNMDSIQESANQNLPGLLNSLRNTLEEMTSRSHSPEILEEIKKGPVGQLIQDRQRYRVLETGIRSQAANLAKTKGETTMGKTKTFDQVGKDIIPGNGTKEPVYLQVDSTGSKVTTNKVWAQGWLKTREGATSVQRRINTCNWLKTAEVPAKAGLAFLSFCRQRSLPGVADAIGNGTLTSDEKENVKRAAKRFVGALNSLGIDPEKHSLRTMLLGASALHQYSAARFAKNNPWNPDWEEKIEDISPRTEPEKKFLSVAYAQKIENCVKITSPFRNENPEGVFTEGTETGRNRLKSAARAVSNLYKPVLS